MKVGCGVWRRSWLSVFLHAHHGLIMVYKNSAQSHQWGFVAGVKWEVAFINNLRLDCLFRFGALPVPSSHLVVAICPLVDGWRWVRECIVYIEHRAINIYPAHGWIYMQNFDRAFKLSALDSSSSSSCLYCGRSITYGAISSILQSKYMKSW